MQTAHENGLLSQPVNNMPAPEMSETVEVLRAAWMARNNVVFYRGQTLLEIYARGDGRVWISIGRAANGNGSGTPDKATHRFWYSTCPGISPGRLEFLSYGDVLSLGGRFVMHAGGME